MKVAQQNPEPDLPLQTAQTALKDLIAALDEAPLEELRSDVRHQVTEILSEIKARCTLLLSEVGVNQDEVIEI
jgi:hypothetical protein